VECEQSSVNKQYSSGHSASLGTSLSRRDTAVPFFKKFITHVQRVIFVLFFVFVFVLFFVSFSFYFRFRFRFRFHYFLGSFQYINILLFKHKIIVLTDQVTLAGSSVGFQDGIGSNAKMKYPHGMCLNPHDNCLYVCDTKTIV
jgi:hypothetical protein